MPAETHVDRGPLDRQGVFELIRDQLADILEIEPSDDHRLNASFEEDLDADSLALHRAGGGAGGGFRPRAVGGFRIDDEDLEDLRMSEDVPWITSLPSSGRADEGPVDGLDEGAARLAGRLEHEFADASLLHQALSHPAAGVVSRTAPPRMNASSSSGDAVLGVIVAEHSYQAFPDFPEGKLAKVRAAVVNARVLAEVAEELSIGEVLLLGRGEETSGGRTKASILSDALEAVIGALYLDAGWEPTRVRVLNLLGDRIARAAAEPDDYDDKSRLQEMTVRQGLGVPRYAVVGSGPDHDRKYSNT